MESPRSSPAQVGDHSKTALMVLGEQTLRISELEAENASLRAELEALQTGGVKQERLSSPVRNNASSERDEALTAKYNTLAKRYRDLDAKHKKCDRHIAIANEKWSEAKESARQWKAYAESKHKTRAQHLREAEQAGSITPQSLAGASDDEYHRSADQDITPRAGPTEQKLYPEELQQASDQPREQNAHPVHLSTAQKSERASECTRSRTLRLTSSQTTDSGSDPVNVPSSPPDKRGQFSDSEPIVVFVRSLKRKRSVSALAMPPPVRIKQEPNSLERPIEIKSEDFSSPAHVRHALLRTETSDLDAVTKPRVVVRKLLPCQRAVFEDVERRPSPKLSRRVSSLSDGDVTDQADLSTEGAVQYHYRRLDQDPVSAADDSYLYVADGHEQALRQLSVNVPANRRPAVAHQHAGLKRRRSDKEAATKAALLSEDGESQNVRLSGDGVQTSGHLQSLRTSKKLRLDSLLEEPTSDRQHLVRSHTAESAARVKRKPLTPPISNWVPKPKLQGEHSPKNQSTSIAGGTPTSIGAQFAVQEAAKIKREHEEMNVREARTHEAYPQEQQRKHVSPKKATARQVGRPQGLKDSPPPVRPEDEPLRLRPLYALRLEDFKVNPRTIGADHAFSDTVRGRARRCLPGCIKPDCCGGAFMKAVQMNGHHGAGASDAQVLEAYFGANWQAIVRAYPRDKRESLVLEARASTFANQYGKHRNAFERRSTPPGFWRTDMPTTQQVEEDRMQAHTMVRQKVEERYREAMRDGGRWLFRDE